VNTKLFQIHSTDGIRRLIIENTESSPQSSLQIAIKDNFEANTIILHGQNGTGTFSGAVTAFNFQLSSDIRYKNVLEDLGGDEIKYIKFNTDKDSKTRYGVSAQQVQKVEPDLVEEVDGKLTVKYIDLLIREVAKLTKRIGT